MSGKVFLVGAGPGDPGLLTLKAARLLESAEVVVLDALVSPEIKALLNPAAEIIYAGKRASNHAMTQDAINALLVDLGRSGKRVVRLKGGDPFVFGRGGEEAESLRQAGVAFEIVPGISSAIAAPAYAGIPVTHRSLATSFTVVTGHESDSSSGVDWPSVSKIPGTVIFLMGLSQLENITAHLIENGRPPRTPVAVVSRGTTPRQRSVSGTLDTISQIVREAAIEPPALIVVGEVAALRDSLSWFETKPLFGKRVVVTRARAQASDLARILAEAGAEVLEYPTIEIAAPSSFDSLDRCIATLGTCDWIVFSSTNGVDSFFDRLLQSHKDARMLSGLHVAAVGNSTAERLAARGIRADIVPERFQSSALLPLLPEDLSGMRFAIVRAASGNDEFLDALRARGANVDLVVAYETRAVDSHGELGKLITEGKVDAVTFTSGSTVDNFFEQLNGTAAASHLVYASIGPVTSAALRKHQHEPTIESSSADVSALAQALCDYYSER